jgi:aryl-alcohol dehydrogenase-like predicted oxidoreductase
MIEKLALGTAQFGFDYGVANRNGRIAKDEVRLILAEAARAGVDVLDTAIAYGESEKIIGEVGGAGFRISTKIPELPLATGDIAPLVQRHVEASLDRLKIKRLEAVLLHRPAQLSGERGVEIAEALKAVKEKGFAKKIGVSIYDPSELTEITAVMQPDVVQSPFNILDRRLVSSGWLARLKTMRVEVHIRSIFLQGLLLMSPLERPSRFSQWREIWHVWDNWLANNQLSGLEASFRFALHQADVTKVVIGVDSLHHLRQILALPRIPLNSLPDFGLDEDKYELLVTPPRWNAL